MQFFFCTILRVNSEGLRERGAAKRMSCRIHPDKGHSYWDPSSRGGSVEMLPVMIIACI